jgi:LuxR family maltose regulon positive regulatory protein
LTLISAPAGFGKTTLVSEWVGQLLEDVSVDPGNNYRVAWLSLDEGDNEPARFLSYLIASINQIEGLGFTFGEAIQNMIQSPQPPPIDILITTLINEIIETPIKLLFILDDYHLVSSAPIDDVLLYFFEHLPPQFHFVIITRDDPQLPLARMRVNSELNEIRATDLRFNSTEVGEFLNQVMDLNLTEENIEAIETRTEGWIAGLQLAAISMQGQEDATQFIKSFTGSHRLVLDYLIEEVLEQQSEHIKSFLLQTAVLTRLNGPLCDVLTGQQDGQQILESLELANLFIIPLDNERRWYRYHHLFADLLQSRLRYSQSEEVPALHQRASAWFEENGYIDEAVEHTILAEEFGRAVNLLEENVVNWFERGDHIKLRRWLSTLPEQLLLERPFLSLIQAAILVSGGQLEEGDRLLKVIELRLEGKPDVNGREIVLGKLSEPERKMLSSFGILIRSYLAFYQGDVEETIELAKMVLKPDSDSDPGWYSSAVLVLGDAYTAQGDMSSAYQMQLEALEMSKSDAENYMILVTSLKLASTLRMQGKLREVQKICHQEMKRAVENGFSQINVAGWLQTIWGETLTELNQLDEAYQKTSAGIELAGSTTDVNMLGLSNLNHIRVLFSRGDLSGAEEVIEKLEKINLDANIPSWIFSQISSWKARIWLSQGKYSAVSRWVEERWLDAQVLPADLPEMEQIMIARYLLSQREFGESLKLLEHLLEAAEAGGRISRVIEIKLLQALSLHGREDNGEAISRLQEALILAEPEGFIRTFVDEGLPMEALLKRLKLENERLKEHTQKLLIAFRIQTTAPSAISPQPLIDPLSERELEVLQLISEGLTNQQIAERLYLSLHTIKVHASNIYSKLGVHNRSQAGSRARELGMLD